LTDFIIFLTEGSRGDLRFAGKSLHRRIRLIGGRLTHLLHLQTILVIQPGVLHSPHLSDGDAAVAESGGVISGSDELRLERTDDKVLDVAVGLRRRIQLHFRGRACTINQLKRPVKIK